MARARKFVEQIRTSPAEDLLSPELRDSLTGKYPEIRQ
jgi:hypothetical protein